jgi:O-Antigen ligase
MAGTAASAVADAVLDVVEASRLRVGADTSRFGRRLLAQFARLLPLLLAGHALFDRGFAYVGVPHTPAYVTELVLALGLAAAVCVPHPFRLAFQQSPLPATLLVGLMLWSGSRALTQVSRYGLLTVRDFAICYYMSFAFLTAAVVASMPDWLPRLMYLYRRFIPWLFAWSAVAIVVSAIPRDVGPLAPGSQVPLLAHRIGDLEVQLAVAVAFLWLAPSVVDGKRRTIYTLIGLLLIGAAGTQNRGGFVAASITLAVAVAFAGGRRRGMAGVGAIIASLILVVALVDPQIRSERRTVSFHQLAQNVSTIAGGKGSGDLNNTVQWRSDLWKDVMSKTISEGHGLFGWGFGPDLGTQFAFGVTDPAMPLRSPHNSHVDIVARTGPVGAVLWVGVWATWFGMLLRRRAGSRRRGDEWSAALIEVLMLAALASLVNAYFDPTLEAAPAAVFLWVVFGLGLTAPWATAFLPAPAPPPAQSRRPPSR